MIRDYFPPWELFEKRHAQPHLVSATHSLPESGQLSQKPYSQTRYSASFSGNYYPSKSDYTSYAYGLTYGGFALMTTGFGLYFYRRRRNRPYREVRFHE
jgi:LPXTG-motif cell wall-anchored protein